MKFIQIKLLAITVRDGEACIDADLLNDLAIREEVIRSHFGYLTRYKLVTIRREGKKFFYRATKDGMELVQLFKDVVIQVEQGGDHLS